MKHIQIEYSRHRGLPQPSTEPPFGPAANRYSSEIDALGTGFRRSRLAIGNIHQIGKQHLIILSAIAGWVLLAGSAFALHTETALPAANDDFSFALARNNDLCAIKRRNTDAQHTEIYVLSAASLYKSIVSRYQTHLEETPEGFAFALGANNDLYERGI